MLVRTNDKTHMAVTRIIRIALVILFGCVSIISARPECALAAVIGDTYPQNLKAANKNALVDPWNFYNRQCTSFAAFCLNSRNGFAFHNHYGGRHWGNAGYWGGVARGLGIAVDSNPAVGAIAWWDNGSNGGSMGHVAWVAEVAASTVTIEEYNWNNDSNYRVRTIARNNPSGYIHFSDLPVIVNNPPIGYIDIAEGGPGYIRVKGWAFDRDDLSRTLAVDVYMDGPAGTGGMMKRVTANKYRPDVNNIHHCGNYHGFDESFLVSRRGNFSICMHALDASGGPNPVIINTPGDNGMRAVRVSDPRGSAVTNIRAGRYMLRPPYKLGYTLDVNGGNNNNRASVMIGPWNGGLNQQFDISSNSDGSYTLRAAHSGKVVEVYGESVDNYADVVQFDSNGGPHQRWWIERNSDGTFSLRNALSGRYLDKENGELMEYRNVWQHAYNGTAAQRWYLVPTSYVDVYSSTPHNASIKWMTNKGVSLGWGCSDASREFRPGTATTRADLAAFLFRLAANEGLVSDSWSASASQKRAFSDVTASTPHAREIWWMAASGISTGFPNGTFRPYDKVRRCDLAAFLFRMAKKRGKVSESWSTSSYSRFKDVRARTSHSREIMWMASRNITTGFPDGTFRPNADVTRQDLAAFLQRLDGLS